MDKIQWFVIAALVGVPFILSLYMLVTPVDRIQFSYENYRISRSHRALKDRHFRYLPRAIRILKVVSFVVMILCLWEMVRLVKSARDAQNFQIEETTEQP